jgi:hypothetical protein
MISVPNFTIDDDLRVRSFWRDSNPHAQPVPPQLKPFVVLKEKESVGWMNGSLKMKTPSTYTEVVFSIERAKIRVVPGIDGFCYDGIKGVTLCFGYRNRAQNEKYDVQSIDEIKKLVGI